MSFTYDNVTAPAAIHTGPMPMLPRGSNRLAGMMSIAAASLLIWRIWRFVIAPMLYPQCPKEYPYWIPCHSRAFFKDSNGLLYRAKKYFKDSGEPFAITALGITFYVVTQEKHSAEVYKNSETLSFESFVQGLMRANGNTEDVVQLMYSALPVDKPGFPNPNRESLGVLAQKMHTHQLQPGKELLILQHKVLGWIDRNLVPDTLHKKSMYTLRQDSPSTEVPLYKWCSDYFVSLGQWVYFGDLLDDINPQLTDAFFNFDELIWKMLYNYPNVLSSDMAIPRAEIVASLRQYFAVPKEQRQDCAWLVDAMEDEMRALGVDNDNLAVLIFHLYFAINTNTRKTVFWLLTQLLHNPTAMEAFRRETAPAFSGGQLIDPFYIQNPENCPEVDHIWLETLRLSSWAASVRLITQDTVIGGKLMCKGNRVMVPHRLLHFDDNIFGDEPHSFRPERWQKSNLSRSPSWRPFGAGKTMCSGRFLARFSVTTFVATLLHRFDVEMIGNPAFPEQDEGRPVLGIVSIKEGHDFKVRFTPKA